MKELTLHILVSDDAACPNCQELIDLDTTQCMIDAGECNTCGAPLILDVKEWSVVQ